MSDRIFKGATRPAMMLGMPLLPCILVVGIFLIGAVWTLLIAGVVPGVSVLLVMCFAIAVLRYISSQDDQRLNQYLMYLRSRPFRRNRSFWRAHSMSPVGFKKRSGL